MTEEFPPQNGIFNKLAVILSIVVCAGVVLIPSIVAYLPVEQSKWLVAEARTLLESNKSDIPKEERLKRAKELVEKAEKINPNINVNKDYMDVFSELYGHDMEHIASLIVKQDADHRLASVRGQTAIRFITGQYDDIMKLIDLVYPNIDTRHPEFNNSWAYAAALANVNLDKAEQLIDKALQHGEEGALLDTKAWILHKQGRQEEALVTMQRATIDYYATWITLLENSMQSGSKALKALVQDIKKADPLADTKPEDLLQRLQDAEAGNENAKELISKLENPIVPSPTGALKDENELVKEQLTHFATFRYHREEIIRALGLTKVADWELAAIKKAGFEDPSQLK